jgi:hypothetical protein
MRKETIDILNEAKEAINQFGWRTLLDKGLDEGMGIMEFADRLSKIPVDEAIASLKEILVNYEGYCSKQFAETIVGSTLYHLQNYEYEDGKPWWNKLVEDEVLQTYY